MRGWFFISKKYKELENAKLIEAIFNGIDIDTSSQSADNNNETIDI